MLYYFAGLVLAAVILLATNHRSATNRAAAFFLSCAAIGGLESLLLELPWKGWARLAQLLNVTLTPYGVLLFGLVYYGDNRFVSTRPRMNAFYGCLLLPPLMTIAFACLFDDLQVNYRFVLMWAAPYYLASCWLLIRSLWKEQNRMMRRNRLITTVIMVPTLLAVLAFVYAGRAIAPDFPFFRYIAFFFGYSFAAALLCVFLYGVLGVKLRIEHDPLETAMKSAASGTALLNHTIKNEAGKIALSTLNLRHSIEAGSPQSADHLAIIEQASAQMLQMAGRIHGQMKEIVLEEQPCRITELMEACRANHQPLLAERGILLEADYLADPVMRIDAFHMKAVLDNLIHNAAEAVGKGGIITLAVTETKQHMILSVKDNGRGIPPDEVARVFEPFYTTKSTAANFGLGLSYAYKVMQRSGGTAEMTSRVGSGTVVSLYLPRRKLSG
ncbi:signal transduction histidine kinase [Paenibacillus phyllosphaerae]|uniref:histidine kinase n=1 Tax=Paenibacillus phyllosphaerae TaxID=274593 RepID=A0A7W5AWW6_9BACL|nr:HAMP domain-containing sensor histidine kinase [Paenibacillus phyllosphaerae]MBB3110295.1 signal transduction histidine kinase [Paenibacillus phyllosphaerae]